MFYERGPFDEPRGYWMSVIALVGHVAGTAFMFCAIAALAWLIEVFISWLHSVHSFPDLVLTFFRSVEFVILLVDTFFSAIVLIAGMHRFIRDLARGHP